MGTGALIHRLAVTLLAGAALVAGAPVLRSSEGPVLVAGAEAEADDAIAGPGSSTDPLRCVTRLAIPSVDQALEESWAPDSSHLAVTHIVTSASRRTVTGFEEDPSLAVLDLATGALADLGAGTRPQWSSSGSYLSFWRGGRLYVVHAGAVVTTLEPSMPETRWAGDQLVYFQQAGIRGWTEADDVVISTVSPEYMPRYPQDWTEFSADAQMFTLTRYHTDGSAERYVGETRTGQLAPLVTPGTTYTEWAPAGQTLLVRSDASVELRGPNGADAVAPVATFPGAVHGWTPEGKALLMGKVTPTLPVGPFFDTFVVWDGTERRGIATLPNLLGSRAFSPDGRAFAGVARTGLYETTLEVYRCGAPAEPVGPRADPVSRGRQQRVDADPRHFVRPVAGYFSQFLQGFHTGIDVAAPFGSLITAADAGDVTFVGWRPVGGRAVCVQHAGGLESCYYHTSLALVAVGQHVARGEPMAAIGMTGLTTGPHVHWETKQNGLIVDPLKR